MAMGLVLMGAMTITTLSLSRCLHVLLLHVELYWMAGCSSASAVQTLRNWSLVSAAPSSTEHDEVPHPDPRHCSSVASVVFQLLWAVRTTYDSLRYNTRWYIYVRSKADEELIYQEKKKIRENYKKKLHHASPAFRVWRWTFWVEGLMVWN